jgi:hypothetical protein
MTTSNEIILKRIEIIEAELAALRRQLSVSSSPRIVSTRGILKDVAVTDQEIEEAKSLWNRAADDQRA